jgi:hypothetical protein
VKAIEEQGTWVIDNYDGGYVTTLVNGSECAYVIFDEKERQNVVSKRLMKTA